MGESDRWSHGAAVVEGEARFCVWAPAQSALSLELELNGQQRVLGMESGEGGRFQLELPVAECGRAYSYLLSGGRRRPDPASRLLDAGVHGRSLLVELAFPWGDGSWLGVPREQLVIYELHVTTFTPEGTLDAALKRMSALQELGVTAVELMPLSPFEGTRGWGYDGVQPWGVARELGGPKALQRFIDRCHGLGLAVLLDVVHNHLGPAGNYLRDFGPYFSRRHQTPWGEALNFDGEGAEGVRSYFIESALSWVRDFHADGLRLDAVHGLVDESPRHILEELSERFDALERALGRKIHLIAESDLNAPRLVRRREEGGFGLHAQWSDDFHHSLHALLTGERRGYYVDFGGGAPLAKVYDESFALTGEYSRFRGRPHGESARGVPRDRFVVCSQNHDQVGNRALGDRLGMLVGPERLRFAAATTLLSPFIPLLFMGEEYGEVAPFAYFTSFEDGALARAVVEGRGREFARFGWPGSPPSPQEQATFERARLHPALAALGPNASLRAFYARVLEARRRLLRLAGAEANSCSARWSPRGTEGWGVIDVALPTLPGCALRLLLNADEKKRSFQLDGGDGAPVGGEDAWRVELDSLEGAEPSQWPRLVEAASALALAPWQVLLLSRGHGAPLQQEGAQKEEQREEEPTARL